MSTRILVVDDHGVLRAGLSAVLSMEPGMEVVGVAADGQEAITKCALLKPDIILMDISLGEVNGIEITHQLHQTSPGTKILILTVHEEINFVQQALAAGASGYILKKASMNEVVCAIQAALRGELYIHPALTREFLATSSEVNEKKRSTPDIPLSPREIEVVQWVVNGYTNWQISKQLGIGIRTVEYHRRNIMCKLGFDTRDQLVKFANEHKV